MPTEKNHSVKVFLKAVRQDIEMYIRVNEELDVNTIDVLVDNKFSIFSSKSSEFNQKVKHFNRHRNSQFVININSQENLELLRKEIEAHVS